MPRATRTERLSDSMLESLGLTIANVNNRLDEASRKLHQWDSGNSTPEETRELWKELRGWYRLAILFDQQRDLFPLWVLSKFPEEKVERSLIFGHPQSLKEVSQYSGKCRTHYGEECWRFLLFFDNVKQTLARRFSEVFAAYEFTSLLELYTMAEGKRAERTKERAIVRNGRAVNFEDMVFKPQDLGSKGSKFQKAKGRRRPRKANKRTSMESDDSRFTISSGTNSVDLSGDAVETDISSVSGHTADHASQDTTDNSFTSYKAPNAVDCATTEGIMLSEEDPDLIDVTNEGAASHNGVVQLNPETSSSSADTNNMRYVEHSAVAVPTATERSDGLEVGPPQPYDSKGHVHSRCVDVARSMSHYSDAEFVRSQANALPFTMQEAQLAEQECMALEQRLQECRNRRDDLLLLADWQKKADGEGSVLLSQMIALQQEHETVKASLQSLRQRAVVRMQFLHQLSFHDIVTEDGGVTEEIKQKLEEEKMGNQEQMKLQKDLADCEQRISQVADDFGALRAVPKCS